MKETHAQIRKFFHEAWWEWFRWMFLLCLISMGLATLILRWKFQTYPFIIYLCCFLGSLAGSWIYMFLRRPQRGEFAGDR